MKTRAAGQASDRGAKPQAALPRPLLWAVLVLAAVAVVGFAAWAALDLLTIGRTLAAGKWPTVTGQVLSAAVTPHCGGDAGAFGPEISYRYQVGDQAYTGQRIDFGSRPCGSRRWAEAVVFHYPVGSTVLVHVNPQQGDEAALKAGGVRNPIIIGLLLKTCGMALFVLLGLEVLRPLWRQARRPAASPETAASPEKKPAPKANDLSGYSIFDNGEGPR